MGGNGNRDVGGMVLGVIYWTGNGNDSTGMEWKQE